MLEIYVDRLHLSGAGFFLMFRCLAILIFSSSIVTGGFFYLFLSSIVFISMSVRLLLRVVANSTVFRRALRPGSSEIKLLAEIRGCQF